MSYNLLLNTAFKNKDNWTFTNCEYKNGQLHSNSKLFGISQELILPNPTKLYFRLNYKAQEDIKNIIIGIQIKDKLNVIQKIPKVNKRQIISIIEDTKQEQVKLVLIIESKKDKTNINIDGPLLVDINKLKKSTILKHRLDKELYFMNGYNYKNIYNEKELKSTLPDLESLELEDSKIGSIFNNFDEKVANFSAKLIEGKFYLAKLDFELINQFGDVFLNYGATESIKIDEEQLYIIFKANSKNKLTIHLQPNDIISFKVNLKHILIIDISNMNLLSEDIEHLSFV